MSESSPDHHTETEGQPPAAPSRWKYWFAVILLLLTALITGRLGVWQLSRADEKLAVIAEATTGRAAAPLALEPGTPPDQLRAWRRAWARGVWLPDHSVLLDNRNLDGIPGYWLLTPLCLLPADAPEFDGQAPGQAVDCPTAVAVLRGWLPRPRPDAAGPALPALPELPFDGVVEGELLAHVPRLFDLRALTGRDEAEVPVFGDGPPVVQNLQLDAYAQATGLVLLPTVLQQAGDASDGLRRDWAGPSADADKNRGYALQWFTFAAIALIALGVLLVQAFRRSRRDRH